MTKARRPSTHVCCFSALDDLKAKDRGDPVAVLRVLDKVGRFSIFEATEHQKLARVLTIIQREGWAVYEDLGYPWTRVTLTEIGRIFAGLQEP